MIYLASVYSLNSDADLRQQRYEYVLKEAAEFTKLGYPIFSPIVHSHPMSLVYDMPCTFDFWEKVDYKFIDASSQLWVLMMDGWTESNGVQAEIKYARSLGMKIYYLNAENSPPASAYMEQAA